MRSVILLFSLILIACGGDGPEPVVEIPTFETNYTVVSDESHIRFSATQEGEGFTGEFTEFDAAINFDPDALESSRVRVTVSIASFDGGTQDRNSNVSGKVWFSTKEFPNAVFETEMIRADGDSYLAHGTLTMKGIAQPIVFAFDIENVGARTVMTANFPINRTRWTIGQKPWDTEEYVGLEIGLDIRVVAELTP